VLLLLLAVAPWHVPRGGTLLPDDGSTSGAVIFSIFSARVMRKLIVD